MSDKVKPWHQRKPKHHGDNHKKVVPLRAGGDKRISPLRASDEEEIDQLENRWLEDQLDNHWES